MAKAEQRKQSSKGKAAEAKHSKQSSVGKGANAKQRRQFSESEAAEAKQRTQPSGTKAAKPNLLPPLTTLVILFMATNFSFMSLSIFLFSGILKF